MNGGTQCHRQQLEALHDEAFRWAVSCCRYDRDRAQDVMQSVYVEILSGRAVYRGKAAFRTWLFAVVRRTAQRLLRAERLHRDARERLQHIPLPDAMVPDACSQAQRRQDAVQVLAALTGLPLMQRQIIELVFYRGFTVEEAGHITGISTGSARTHFHRAKKALALALEETAGVET